MKHRYLTYCRACSFLISHFSFLICMATPMHIETDRSWYLAGEAMTVSMTDDGARIAYAELCDTHGLAAGVVIGLKGGAGKGVIELPANLHSGYYMLSAYTRHNTEVSQRLIAVVNPLHKNVDDDIRWEILDEDVHISSFYETAEPNPENEVGNIFRQFPQLNVSEMAKYIGINKSLLAKYIYGIKKPSPERLEQIRYAIHSFGEKLVAV